MKCLRNLSQKHHLYKANMFKVSLSISRAKGRMKNKVLKGKVTHQLVALGRTQKGNSPTFILAPLIACVVGGGAVYGGGETFFIRAFKSSPYMFHKQAKGKLDSTASLLESIGPHYHRRCRNYGTH